MTGRLLAALWILAILLGFGDGLSAQQAADPSLLTVERIFDSNEFRPESVGRTRWLDDGSAYTMVEDSEETEKGKDIVAYDPLTGAQEILVPAQQLIPDGESKPLTPNTTTDSKQRNRRVEIEISN